MSSHRTPRTQHPSSSIPQNRHAAHRTRAAEVVCQAQLGVLHLAGAGLVPQVLADFVEHANSGGADRVTERLQATARVDRQLAADAGPSLGDKLAAFSPFA